MTFKLNVTVALKEWGPEMLRVLCSEKWWHSSASRTSVGNHGVGRARNPLTTLGDRPRENQAEGTCSRWKERWILRHVNTQFLTGSSQSRRRDADSAGGHGDGTGSRPDPPAKDPVPLACEPRPF